MGNKVEEELDGIGITWRVAKFIENNKIEFGEAFEKADVIRGCGNPKVLDEIRKTIKGDFFEEFARLDAEGNGEVSFARAGLSVQE